MVYHGVSVKPRCKWGKPSNMPGPKNLLRGGVGIFFPMPVPLKFYRYTWGIPNYPVKCGILDGFGGHEKIGDQNN